jgi:hypothetical protein
MAENEEIPTSATPWLTNLLGKSKESVQAAVEHCVKTTHRLRAARLNCTAVTTIDPAAGEIKDGGDSGAIQPLQRMQAMSVCYINPYPSISIVAD